jgi:2-polyprenyl-6-methoxyphenol hydroxylase-like FAD-dependent oxidoreductase
VKNVIVLGAGTGGVLVANLLARGPDQVVSHEVGPE